MSNLKKKSKKIILNSPEDLLKISNEDFEKINISNLYGQYYEQIYKEALEQEEKNIELAQKKKSKNIKDKTLKSILKNNNRRKYENQKLRSKSKEKKAIIKKPNYKIIVNNFNNTEINTINNNKHLFSPEIPPKKYSFEFDYKNNIENKENNKNKFKLNQNNNKKIKVNLLPNLDASNKSSPKKINSANIQHNYYDNITDINKALLDFNNTKYKSDEIAIVPKVKNNIKENEYIINKIIFYIRYDSNYGDNIGVLGSIEQLGNWSEDKILYLKWNNGNIWKGDIDITNLFINKFEFKFIKRHDGIIYWEKGFNNVVDLKEINGELKYHKKGRYNKYEYNYNINNFEIILTCKIKGWE